MFLAGRNILANQAYNVFSAFPDDALVRIAPADIRKKGRVPKNVNIFFTIFQTFMSGPPVDGKPTPYFGEYPADFFDFIVIDECHRGGANDEGSWRGILNHFAPAVQLGLTATPKRTLNADTYNYFGDPVFVMIDQREKTIVFCATQNHALAVRDLINQAKTSTNPNYCVRVTEADHRSRDAPVRRQGPLHDRRLREGAPPFQRPGMGRRADRTRPACVQGPHHRHGRDGAHGG